MQEPHSSALRGLRLLLQVGQMHLLQCAVGLGTLTHLPLILSQQHALKSQGSPQAPHPMATATRTGRLLLLACKIFLAPRMPADGRWIEGPRWVARVTLGVKSREGRWVIGWGTLSAIMHTCRQCWCAGSACGERGVGGRGGGPGKKAWRWEMLRELGWRRR